MITKYSLHGVQKEEEKEEKTKNKKLKKKKKKKKKPRKKKQTNKTITWHNRQSKYPTYEQEPH